MKKSSFVLYSSLTSLPLLVMSSRSPSILRCHSISSHFTLPLFILLHFTSPFLHPHPSISLHFFVYFLSFHVVTAFFFTACLPLSCCFSYLTLRPPISLFFSSFALLLIYNFFSVAISFLFYLIFLTGNSLSPFVLHFAVVFCTVITSPLF